MAIYQKQAGGVWYAQVYVRDLGKAVRFSTHKKDEAEAREVERVFQAAHNRTLALDKLHALLDTLYGEEVRPVKRGIPLASAFERYREQLDATGRAPSKHTLAARRNSLSRLLSWRDENYPACLYAGEVTRSVAGQFATAFNAAPGLSDKSKRECVSDLGAMWNVLMAADETIAENPWRFFLKAIKRQKSGTAFTPEEEAAILAACAGTEWYAASVISRWTGLRLGDVCHLQWSHVDFDERVIRVRPSKTTRHSIYVTVPMSGTLAAMLAKLPRRENAILPELNATYPHQYKASCGPFSAVLARAGITGRRFHDWRHTFASRLADAGVRTELIKKMGGWTQTATALHYQHSERIDELRAAISQMERQQIQVAEPTLLLRAKRVE